MAYKEGFYFQNDNNSNNASVINFVLKDSEKNKIVSDAEFDNFLNYIETVNNFGGPLRKEIIDYYLNRYHSVLFYTEKTSEVLALCCFAFVDNETGEILEEGISDHIHILALVNHSDGKVKRFTEKMIQLFSRRKEIKFISLNPLISDEIDSTKELTKFYKDKLGFKYVNDSSCLKSGSCVLEYKPNNLSKVHAISTKVRESRNGKTKETLENNVFKMSSSYDEEIKNNMENKNLDRSAKDTLQRVSYFINEKKKILKDQEKYCLWENRENQIKFRFFSHDVDDRTDLGIGEIVGVEILQYSTNTTSGLRHLSKEILSEFCRAVKMYFDLKLFYITRVPDDVTYNHITELGFQSYVECQNNFTSEYCRMVKENRGIPTSSSSLEQPFETPNEVSSRTKKVSSSISKSSKQTEKSVNQTQKAMSTLKRTLSEISEISEKSNSDYKIPFRVSNRTRSLHDNNALSSSFRRSRSNLGNSVPSVSSLRSRSSSGTTSSVSQAPPQFDSLACKPLGNRTFGRGTMRQMGSDKLDDHEVYDEKRDGVDAKYSRFRVMMRLSNYLRDNLGFKVVKNNLNYYVRFENPQTSKTYFLIKTDKTLDIPGFERSLNLIVECDTRLTNNITRKNDKFTYNGERLRYRITRTDVPYIEEEERFNFRRNVQQETFRKAVPFFTFRVFCFALLDDAVKSKIELIPSKQEDVNRALFKLARTILCNVDQRQNFSIRSGEDFRTFENEVRKVRDVLDDDNIVNNGLTLSQWYSESINL
jgi:hypothetical protein